MASLVFQGQRICLPMQEMWVRSLGFGKISWRQKWQPTPVCLPGKLMDRGAWRATVHGVTESDLT